MYKYIFAAVLVTALFVSGCSEKEIGSGDLKTQIDSVSYAIGLDMGKNFKAQSIDIQSDVFLAGLKDGLEDTVYLLNDEEIQSVLMNFQMQMMEKRQKEMQEAGDNNKKEADTFFEENKTKEGIVTTESGLQYKVIEEGSGKTPGDADTVVVHYKGTLLDGTVFDSSYDREAPATFPVGGVIAGWTEGLKLMKEGGKYELYIPSDLAYGPNGQGMIGPNQALVFEVELIEVK